MYDVYFKVPNKEPVLIPSLLLKICTETGTVNTFSTKYRYQYRQYFVGNVAERVKAPFLWRPQSRDLGKLQLSSHTLLRPWIRHFTMINYLCLVASNKQQIQLEEVKETTGKLGNEQLLSGCGFV